MHVKIRILSVIWKFIIAVVVGLGVIAQFGALYPRTYSLSDLTTLSYLTIFFNVFIALYFLIAALWLLAHGEKDDRGREWCVGLKHALLVSMLFVGIASSGLLANIPFIHPIAIEHASTVLTLYSPLMITLDWLVFEKKGQMHVLSPVAWLLLPAIYFALVFAGMKYSLISTPYASLDVSSLGVNQVALGLIGVAIVFLALGFVLFVVDLILSAMGGTGGKSHRHHRKRRRPGSRGSSRRPRRSSKGSSSSQNAGNKTIENGKRNSTPQTDDEEYSRSIYGETPYDERDK